jgi:cobalt-zinc-cadmium efflux system membrane fusion protein
MRSNRAFRWLLGLAVVLAATAGAYATRERWLVWLGRTGQPQTAEQTDLPPDKERTVLELSPQARKNLGLVARPVNQETYWRTILIPGEIVDRPGVSDRGVTAPAVGIVAEIHAFPGNTVKPGDRLFTLRLNSEYLQNTQSELFKTTRDAQLTTEQRARIAGLAESGTIAQAKVIELDNQLRRQNAAIMAHRQDLLTRGLSPVQVEAVAAGEFVSTIDVLAPPPQSLREPPLPEDSAGNLADDGDGPAYEVQELRADLGQQVQAGQLLGVLANHESLYIEGHAFKRESPFLEQAAQHGWPVRVEFAEDDQSGWPDQEQTLQIRYLANAIDPASRTFDFFIPLTNQSRTYEKDGRTFLVWRFRPGQRVRLHVPVEEMRDVFVLPASAVVRVGPEAYVFRQNGDLFDRLPVHVLHEDRLNVVIANDGGIKPRMYLAQSAAASLNRVLKAQSAEGGLPPGAHFHADGSLHIPGE